MANEQNLHPSEYKLSQEEAKKGGIRSGQVRREKADFKKKCQIWMESEVAKDKNGKAVTGADLMIAVAGRGIKNGSTKFWELMRDTAGYKPIDKVMVSEVDQSIIDEVEAAVLGVDDDDERTSD
jgi:hypothetical protein